MNVVDQVVEGFGLSPQQRRVWNLLESGEPSAYGARIAAVVEHGDADAVEAAVRQVADRHEILRTRFRRVPGMGLPIQEIGERPRLELVRRRATRGPEEDLGTRALGELERAKLDPEDGPLGHVSITPLADGSRTLVCARLSALVADDVAALNLAREVRDLCHRDGVGEFRSGDGSEPIQYADAAEVLNELLDSEDTREGREYWHRIGEMEVPEAPALHRERTDEPVSPFLPRELPSPVTEEAAGAIRDLCGRFGAPERAIWLAAWAVVLSRYTGRAEIPIGVQFAGRSYDGLDEALGPFARVVPVVCGLRTREPFRALVGRVAEVLAEAEERQEYYERDRGDAGAGATHDLPWVLSAGEPLPSVGTGLRVHHLSACIDRSELELTSVRPAGPPVTGLRYDAGKVPSRVATGLLDGLAALLETVTGDPDIGVELLDGLAPDLRRDLLEGLAGSDARTGVHQDRRRLEELVAGQAERSPDSTALVDGRSWLSYGELRRRTARLREVLHRCGVVRESRVALCLDRSVRQVVALLGALEAGAAYLPVDPALPSARIALLLEEAEPRAVITDRETAERMRLDELVDPRRLVVLAPGEEPSGPRIPEASDGERPEAGARSADDLAYILYTSGSTGRPKGVMVPHRAIVNRIEWMAETFPFGAGDTVLYKTPLSFDASIWEIFAPLACGARTVLATEGEEREGAALLRTAERQRVTVLQLVPSHLRAILAERSGPCSSLKRLFCGGEELPEELVARASEGWGVSVCNLYGPTEAAIDTTFQPADRRFGGRIVPIGRPISNARVLLLDDALRLVPPGAPGEIGIAGAGLARGYLRDPARTAESFVPEPHAREPGARLYRTGDRARFQLSPEGEAGGTLEFFGRVDDQVKIRGVRIELGEPAAVLRRHPRVADAVVSAHEGPGDGRMLVAHVVVDGDGDPAAELRSFLEERIPEAAIPAVFVPMDALPLKTNGKLDRSALPAPDAVGGAGGGTASLRTQTERIVAGIFEEVLRVEGVGAHSSYLELGGHSLLATQVISRIRNVFSVDLPLKSLFETPEVAPLARRVERAREAGRGIEIPPLAPSGVGPGAEHPLSFAQQRLWFLHRLQPDSPSFNSSIGLWLDGSLDRSALERSLREVVRRHEVLRTVFPDRDGKPFQWVLPAPRGVLRSVDLSGLPAALREGEALRLATAEARRPFDLRRGPLLRAWLVRLSERRHGLLFTLHHICGDGWSTGLLVREFSTLYEAFRRGRSSPLPPLSIQYGDFARWQRSWLRDEVLERQADHWRRTLSGAPPTIDLDTDRPRPSVRSGAGARFSFHLDTESTDDLRRLGRREQATLFMVGMAAFQTLLHLRSGQDDLVVGTDVANRNRAETEGLIGFFVNQLALRARFSPGITFRGLLEKVRRTALEAYDHQDLPFEKLVEIVRPERRAERLPLFQVKLNFQNAPSVPVELAGLRVSRMEVRRRSSQLDLIVNLEETAEGGLQGSAEYDTDLWREETVRDLIEDYRLLLRHLAHRPDEPLAAGREVLADVEAERRKDRAREFGEAGLRMLRDRRSRRGGGNAGAAAGGRGGSRG